MPECSSKVAVTFTSPTTLIVIEVEKESCPVANTTLLSLSNTQPLTTNSMTALALSEIVELDATEIAEEVVPSATVPAVPL